MKHASLAAHYRPQTFAEVTGQEMVTAVLSRAAAEDRVAPAYLLSGTRGVGKTTIARILAKALNCVNAPGPEPCNQCDQCRKITQGSHVDVTEIDGASNNSVEDARALRENIGYAPMEGRYKVFIIDEAHMLSRSAFNALLKTLEEPPPRVVFVFATTEAHKFPITIVSRCQHFIFKRLPEEGLVKHLTRVLTEEKTDFDPAAVRLLARRAAGSVRDSMSLLGQTLALGGESLSLEATRQVLGLAGQDLFSRLMDSLVTQDCVAVTELMSELMDQGVDIGFFLRELTSLWRTLFLLRQAGRAVLPSLALPDDEAELWLATAPRFSLAHIHAAWHMTLEAQRKVIHSPEPAAALELLLLNLALMPRLLPLEKAHHLPESSAPAAPAAPQGPASPTGGAGPTGAAGSPARAVPSVPSVPPATSGGSHTASPAQNNTHPVGRESGQNPHTRPMAAPVQNRQHAPEPHYGPEDEHAPGPVPEYEPMPDYDPMPEPMPEMAYDVAPTPRAETASAPRGNTAAPVNAAASATAPRGTEKDAAPGMGATPGKVWKFEDICAYFVEQGKGIIPSHFLRQTRGRVDRGEKGLMLTLATDSASVYEKLDKLRGVMQTMAADLCAMPVEIELNAPTRTHKTEAMLKEEFTARAELQPCLEILDAQVSRVRPLE